MSKERYLLNPAQHEVHRLDGCGHQSTRDRWTSLGFHETLADAVEHAQKEEGDPDANQCDWCSGGETDDRRVMTEIFDRMMGRGQGQSE